MPSNERIRLHDREETTPVDQPRQHDQRNPRRIVGAVRWSGSTMSSDRAYVNPAETRRADQDRPARCAKVGGAAVWPFALAREY
jgi:hypothetical protein